MAQLNDCKFLALRDLGYAGAIDDMELAWGADNGLPEGAVGVPWYNALIEAGYTGHINDMAQDFWCNGGGTFSLRADRGWTDGENCASGEHVVDFSSEVIFIDHTGVTFYNETTGETTSTFTSATVSPSSQIIYAVTWLTAPAADDTVYWQYDGLGSYKMAYAAALQGWTGTQSCAASPDGTITVEYKDIVSWTDQSGIGFLNFTTGESATGTITATETSPSKLVTYTGATWIVPPAAGDVIQLVITEPNTYEDTSFMDAQTLQLVNCKGNLISARGYGDSFTALGRPGVSANGYTSDTYVHTKNAQGGENLADIRGRFEAEYPFGATNFYIIQGSINNITTVGKITDLATMQADMSAILDVLIANNENFVCIGLSPFGDHAEWTQPRQDQADQYNAWLIATYPANYVDIYNLLGDVDPLNMADWSYKASRSDLHPNGDADRMMDEGIGSHLVPVAAIDMTEPAGNIIANYRDEAGNWTESLCEIAGRAITLSDGALVASKAMVPTLAGVNILQLQKNSTGTLTEGLTATFKMFVRPAERGQIFIQVRDNGGITHQVYFDPILQVIDGTAGTGDTGTWSFRKAPNGWIELSYVWPVIAGTAVVNIDIRGSTTVGNPSSEVYARSNGEAWPAEAAHEKR